jgi:hypothetical protein
MNVSLDRELLRYERWVSENCPSAFLRVCNNAAVSDISDFQNVYTCVGYERILDGLAKYLLLFALTVNKIITINLYTDF